MAELKIMTNVLIVFSAIISSVWSDGACNFESATLSCALRTLHSEVADSGNVQNALRLRIRCSDLFFFDSHMRTEHFGKLPNLEELSIDFCKVRSVPPRAFLGLDHLKTLSLNTHHSEWSSVSMELDERSLLGLHNVRQLDLSHNNLWSVPNKALCDLTNMQTLNLSKNHFLDVIDIGLASSDGCPLPTLTTMDLSGNYISALDTNDLRQAFNLKHLTLRGNGIKILSDNALKNLGSLEVLNLADNRLSALPPTIFNQSHHLQKLLLQNNSLTLLTPELFASLENLVVLNLSRNAISSHLLSAETFSGLKNLQVLDLSFNLITRIQKDVFNALLSLKVLDLRHNQLQVIEANSFQSQAHLEILLLSHNSIEVINNSSLGELTSLRSLVLNHNKLQTVEAAEATNLEDLALNNNALIEVPRFISGLSNLRTLDLGENALLELGPSDFEHCQNLYGLRLAGNLLSTIDQSDFHNLSSLHVLNLAHNRLETVAQGSFDKLSELRALRLDNNLLTDINGVISSLPNLQWFNLSSNQLQWFDYAFLPMSLEWLDIHDNQIEELGNYYQLRSGFNLKTLDASDNLIATLPKTALPTSLEHLILNENRITSIEPYIFEDKPHLRRVELTANLITHLELSSLALGKVSMTEQPEFYIGGNPFRCDCHMEWLQNTDRLSSSGFHPKIMDVDSLLCSAGNDSFVPVAEVTDFMCQYETHCTEMCMCCDFYACDCRMQCPDGCACYHNADWSVNVIECGSKGHSDVPLLIPMDATSIRLDGNDLGDLDTPSFLGRKRVVELFLNDSHVTSVSRQTLSGLQELRVLHLENNEIKEIKGHEFESLSSLRELYLNNNDLIHISPDAFDYLPKLSILRLDGNLLTRFPVWNLVHNPLLVGMYLAENIWSCECDFIEPLQGYLSHQADRIADVENMMCVTNELDDEPIAIAAYRPCTESTALSHHRSDPSRSELLPILVSVPLAIVVIIIGFLVVCVFKNKIKNWLYNKSSEIYENRTASSLVSVGSQNLFDVYISYSPKDDAAVSGTLAPMLEQGATSYRLCLHHRCSVPVNASIYSTVAEATESSARVVLVVSKSYLHDEWPQVKAPLKSSLRNRVNKLILLVMDDVNDEDFDSYPELKSYAKQCPVIRWGTQGFFSKLLFFLPESVAMTFQRNVTLRTLQPNPYCLDDSRYAEAVAPSVISSLYSHHTYQSIPEHQHIYHTLEQSAQQMVWPPPTVRYLSRELVQRGHIEPQQRSPPVELQRAEPQVCHAHSDSSASDQHLLRKEADEYIV